MKNIIKNIALAFCSLALIVSCDEDDFTGDSTLEATSPSLSVELDFADSQTLIESETSFTFTVSISEPQVANINISIAQVGGTATDGADFSIPHTVTIPRGATSVSDVISIHADEIAEDTETAIIKIALGAEANVSAINSQTVTFNILNVTEGDLAIGLMWDTLGYQFSDGSEFDPTDLANLRLLISSTPDNSGDIAVADGGSFEAASISASEADGVYYLVADWYSGLDLGDQGYFPLNLTGTFDQVGVINGFTLNFPSALDSSSICSDVYYVLAKITKTGENYVIEEVGAPQPLDATLFEGSYSEVSEDNPNGLTNITNVTLGMGENELIVEGVYGDLFALFWGETFQPGFGNEGLVTIVLNEDGSVTIPEQYMGQTLPGPYDYWINGNGSFNLCEKTITLSFALQFDDTFSDDYQASTVVIELD